MSKRRKEQEMAWLLRPRDGLARIRKRRELREIMNFAPDVSSLRGIAWAPFRHMGGIFDMRFFYRCVAGLRMKFSVGQTDQALNLNKDFPAKGLGVNPPSVALEFADAAIAPQHDG